MNAGESGMNCNASPMLRYCSVLGELSSVLGSYFMKVIHYIFLVTLTKK